MVKQTFYLVAYREDALVFEGSVSLKFDCTSFVVQVERYAPYYSCTLVSSTDQVVENESELAFFVQELLRSPFRTSLLVEWVCFFPQLKAEATERSSDSRKYFDVKLIWWTQAYKDIAFW